MEAKTHLNQDGTWSAEVHIDGQRYTHKHQYYTQIEAFAAAKRMVIVLEKVVAAEFKLRGYHLNVQ